MKKLFTMMLMAMAAIMVSCGDDYDDSALVGRVDDLENRVEELEQLCREMNTNISALQSIVTALQGNDYITSVTPITEGGETIGYTINFAKGEAITIYHGEDGKDGQDGEDGKDGKDGKDGVSPVLGVKQHTDGLYYWTINGEWVKDAEGNMIKAEGQDGKDGSNGTNGEDGKDGQDGANGTNGKDGITPELKVENGVLFVSYDEGETWEELGSAVSEEMYIFKSVEEYDNYVVFTLYDGTELVVAKYFDLVVSFNEQDLAPMAVNSTRDIRYTVESAAEAIEIEVLSSLDLEAEIIADDASQKVGVVRVKSGAELSTTSKVVLLVSDGQKVVMKSIVFEQPGLKVEENTTKEVAAMGGNITLEFFTNMEYEVVIPEEAAEWLTLVPETRAMEKKTITLNATMNMTTEKRSATVTVKATDSELKAEYFISQNGVIKATVEEFLAAEVDDNVWYQLTGVVQNIASTTYGNFDLVDETGTIYVYGLTKTKVTSNDKSFSSLGIDEWDTVTLIGTRAKYNNSAQVGGPAFYVSHEKGEEPALPANVARISFDDKANRTSFSTTQQIWEQNGITVTNDKGASSSNVADYAGPVRFYKSSDLTISAEKAMEKIVIYTSGGNDYNLNLSDASGYTVEGSGTATVTITLDPAVTSFTITGLANQIRVTKIEVTLVEEEAPAHTIADCHTAGEYNVARAQVACIGGSYLIIADETGAVPVYYSKASEFTVGDYVSLSGSSAANGSFPAAFNGSFTTITKLESGEFTYPEAQEVTDLAAFAAAPNYDYSKVTGTVEVIAGTFSSNYYLMLEGQTLKVRFETARLSSAQKELLTANNGKKMEVCGYFYASTSEQVQMMPTSFEEAAEAPKTTVADCTEVGTAYSLDRVQVVAVNNSYMMLADESGAIYATRTSDYDTYETLKLGDWVKISATTQRNEPFPAKLTYMVKAYILENTECTYPEAQEVANLDEFAAAPNYNYSKVTGKVTLEVHPTYGTKNYYITIDGQTAKVAFEYPLTEWTNILAENVDKSVVAMGYFHGLSSDKLNFTPTSIEVAAEPETPKTTVADCYTAGSYTLDRVQVIAFNKQRAMVADETGAIVTMPISGTAIGDWVTVSGMSVANGKYPAGLTSRAFGSKLEAGEYTYPEAEVVADLDAFAAAPNYNYSKVTGKVTTQDFYGTQRYYLTIDGQTSRLYLEYPLDADAATLANNVEKEITVVGYFYGGTTDLNFMCTSIEADDNGGSAGAAEVELNFTMGQGSAYGTDVVIQLVDANSNMATLYVEATDMNYNYWYTPDYGFGYLPGDFVKSLVFAEAKDDFIYEEAYDAYVDTTKSTIMYQGKEYKLMPYAADKSTGVVPYTSKYDASDENTIGPGKVMAEDGTIFTISYSGTLYGGGTGAL